MADTRITAISTTYDRDTISLSTDYLIGDRSGGSSFRAQVDEIVLGVLENIAENVGIGTTSPANALEVGGTLGALSGTRLSVVDTSAVSGFGWGQDADNRAWMLWDTAGDYAYFGTRAAGTSYNDTLVLHDGMVGIGTNAPTYNLTVTSGTGDGVRIFESGGNAVVIEARPTFGLMGTVSSGQDLRLMTDGATKLTITTGGSVGIGTTSPTAKLQVNGSLAIVDGMTAPSTISGYALIYVDSSDGDLKVKFGDGTVKTIATDT